MIAASARPLLVVSTGIHNSGAWDELRGFAEEFEIPVETSAAAKGALPEDHPLSLGCVGRAGTSVANQAARECDVLIGIGTRFGDIDTGGWTLHDIPGRTRLIHIDIDSEELARVFPTALAIVSDARLALQALRAAMQTHKQSRRDAWRERLSELRRAWREEAQPIAASDAVPLTYGRVFADASVVINEVDPDASVLFDTGHALSFGPSFLEARSRFYIHSSFFHRMGWSVPGLVAAKLARPEHKAIAFVGDGSFIMGGTALSTAVEQGLGMAFVVLDNRSLQIERELMVRTYGRHALTDYVRLSDGRPFGPDFVRWAESMGGRGIKVERPEEIAPAVRDALDSNDIPVVVDVEIDREAAGYRAIHYRYPNDFAGRGLEHPPF
jgi:acetolactate synthase-1/2/3 large subunit